MLREDEQTQIIQLYQTGKGSIQDLARIYRVEVGVILDLIGEGHLKNVTIGGDMIDPAEAGPGATMNYGQTEAVPYSTN